jgi:TonB family protein
VARDGRIIRATIVDRSGNRVLDLSVQKALDSVTKLPPFPEGSRDDQRTFTIDFNLKAKHAAA